MRTTTALTTAIDGAPAGSTLVLARHCTYHLTTASSGDDGLPPINKQLTIEGRDSTIVRDGPTAGAFRIFHVTSTGDLRLDVRDPEQHPHQLRGQPRHRHRLRRLTPLVGVPRSVVARRGQL